MTATIRNRADARLWQKKYGPLAPRVGDEAPNFVLSDVRGEQSVSLADFRNRLPVALVFGSFT